MCKFIKLLIITVLLVFSSITIAANEATSFVYPVGSQLSPPTEQTGNANGFIITQNFNTSSLWANGGANGGWCSNTTGPTYTNKLSCETAGNKWRYGHTGVDLANSATCGSAPVVATANGVVEFSGPVTGYGYLLKIRHTLPTGGIIHSLYGHRSSAMMSIGQSVTKGQVVGYVGDSESLGHCHLHFAIYSDIMPLVSTSTIAPVGYLYGDSGSALAKRNTMRYFYDPLLFVNDRNNEWQTTLPGTGYFAVNFSPFQSVTTRTVYVVSGASDAKSLQIAVNAGWMNPTVYWWNGSAWATNGSTWPIDSYTISPGVTYSFGTLRSDLTIRWFLAGNNYLDARWRQDMSEFTTVNASLGFGRALREAYNNNSTWDAVYGLSTMTYEQRINGGIYNATIFVAYAKTDPLIRFVQYYNPVTALYSGWVRVY